MFLITGEYPYYLKYNKLTKTIHLRNSKSSSSWWNLRKYEVLDPQYSDTKAWMRKRHIYILYMTLQSISS